MLLKNKRKRKIRKQRKYTFSISMRITAAFTILIVLLLIFIRLVFNMTVEALVYNNEYKTVETNYKLIKDFLTGDSIEGIEESHIKSNIVNEDIYVAIFHNGTPIFLSNKLFFTYYYEVKDYEDYISMSGKVNSERFGDIDLLVVSSFETEKMIIEFMENVLNVVDVIGILLAIIVGFYISRKMLSPIKEITSMTRDINIHQLNMRLAVDGPDDELRRLSITINEMLDRLEQSFEQQKRFVSDSSHELRTPITVIQGYIDLLARWGKKDEAVLDESIEAIRNETEGMKELIEKLLLLARYDNDTYQMEFGDVDMSQLLNAIVHETRLVDEEHPIIENIQAGHTILGDIKLLKQLLRIIMDNALKYTEDRNNIYVTLTGSEEFVNITIQDKGIGICEEDIPYIFDRFYRAESSRNKEKGGNGLGLSIAKSIVDRHSGEIKVNSIIGSGTEVIIQFKKQLDLIEARD
ncbi:sensor histidine kinase [Vallitalea okinawensis]|uniref:sensor histidine kinase n=1 Tax=Vallitalea okinawensis TaxID=2078660 RepID=UPI001479082F|nr:HAMP domain-containing sensor histidine kinase [Vallitalea okinawensis]